METDIELVLSGSLYDEGNHPETVIEKSDFCKLLDLCFKHSTHFTLSTSFYPFEELIEGDSEDVTSQLATDLNPFYIRTIKAPHWFYLKYANTPIFEAVFLTEPGAKKVLKKYFDNLFLLERNPDDTLGQPMTAMEDLCFFIDNSLLLGTVSHEGICAICPATLEMRDQFEQIAEWHETELTGFMPAGLDLA